MAEYLSIGRGTYYAYDLHSEELLGYTHRRNAFKLMIDSWTKKLF